MGKDNKNAATEAVAALTKAYDNALEVQKNLAADATDEQKEEAQKAVDVAKKALDEASDLEGKPEKPEKLVKVKFLLSPVGKFNLAYGVGEIGEFLEKQADELVEAKYAEFVK
jgi:hypothetical protein